MPDFTQQDQQYTLQEVASHCGLAPYIIRYWEIHFPELGGTDGKKNSYSNNDVALIWRIKKLLYCDHLDIEQAKKRLSQERSFPVQYPAVKNGRTPVPETSARTAQSACAVPVQAQPAAAPAPTPEASAPQPVVQSPAPAVQNTADHHAEERIAELVGELNGLRVERDALQRDLTEMTTLAEDMSRERDEAVENLSMLVAERDALAARAESLSGSEASLSRAALTAQRERDEALAGNAELIRRTEDLRAQLHSAEQERDEARRSIGELQAELAAVQSNNGVSLQARAELAEANGRLQAENERLKADLEKIISQLKELSMLFSRLQS